MFEDTIIAISTPFGYGGLGVVRLSGKKSLSIAKKIFKPKKHNSKILPRRPILGNLYHFEDKDFFEEAYLTFFPAPRTYTREDVVEISCHGSPLILEETIRLGIKAGARHSRPGEFTLRAYLNGRIDILQAEAINDIIQAASFKQAKISYKQLEGKLSQTINSLRNQMINLLCQIEANIEFPDEDLKISPQKITKTITNITRTVKSLIESYNLGKTLSEGITLAILGRANTGKSTLFNSLCGKERAIVTSYPGTTRDYLHERIKIKDSLFTLIDTAGFENAAHPIDKEGIKRGKQQAVSADGLLILFDSSKKESTEDIQLVHSFPDKRKLLLFNKIDLRKKIDVSKLTNMDKNLPFLEISALKGTNLNKLTEMIHSIFVPKKEFGEEVILHLRQKLLLDEILYCLDEGFRLYKDGYPEEIAAEEFRKTIPLVGQLTGEIRTEDILNEIFSRFCVGK
ncbi:MAG: tRNA uridine-5-carboxymethylaminomethyl(34) synthesis GTPase MnmE [Acidobacteriota bacterium]|nr:tRNA uridine-5-carboxymethylaminomethyl(34) synthesis GTPase MnmE [Acidobacteriota bacterium]